VQFEITEQEKNKIKKWLIEDVFPPIVEEQRKDPRISALLFEDRDGVVHPYTGAIGGALTYEFTPTSIGIFLEVTWGRGTPFEKSLNLTDYESL
jgi:hypothetical protein